MACKNTVVFQFLEGMLAIKKKPRIGHLHKYKAEKEIISKSFSRKQW